MRFIIQNVLEASVRVDGNVTGSIDEGLLVFVGVGQGDDKATADKMIRKLLAMRIFKDENGKTNLSVKDIGGGVLLVSQFTLYADCRRGNRPSFTDAGDPATANELYEYIISEVKKEIERTECGIFGADMKVSLVNNGPFTIFLDSADLK
ncbi:D-tyrosyl-tRNA(Tyr) deacylase [Ruminococcaceae bacterium KH2T8]|nr:D-tyrosyl-tRNA(Tyr) deacylase [Ruminococcaceae bacterium KH2T8]